MNRIELKFGKGNHFVGIVVHRQFINIYKNLPANLGLFFSISASLMSVADKTVREITESAEILAETNSNKKAFMKRLRRTKIRFEKHELTLIRLSRIAGSFCLTCQKDTSHLTVAHAAKLFGMSEKTVFTLAENERFHSNETADGKLLICADSIRNFET